MKRIVCALALLAAAPTGWSARTPGFVRIVCALALLAAAPSGAAASGVAVQLPGSDRAVAVEASAVRAAADVSPQRYRVRSVAGAPAALVTRGGTSVLTVLELAGADRSALQTLEITRDDGTIAYLGRDQLQPRSSPPPIVWIAASGRVGFMRDTLGPGDVNAADAFSPPHGTPIRLTVSTTPRLRIELHAAERVAPGEPLDLSAEVDGALPGERLSYGWDLGDGRASSRPAPVVRWAKPGRYAVALDVSGDRGSGGSAVPIVVTVGDPPVVRGNTASGSSGASGNGGAGSGGSGAVATAGSGESGGAAPPRRAARRARTSGPRIAGTLLTSVGAPTARAAGSARAAATAATGPDAETPTAALALVAALGLVGVGAAREARRR